MAKKVFNATAAVAALFAGKPGNMMTAGQAAAVDKAFPNNVWLTFANAAGTAEVNAIRVNDSNQVEFGSPAGFTAEMTAVQDTNGLNAIVIGATADAVNEITVTNAATGGIPLVEASGDDTNVSIGVIAKGTGAVVLGPVTSTGVKLAGDQPILDSSGLELIKFTKTSVAVNEITVKNNSTGAWPEIAASGETNVSLQLSGKGTGLVLVGDTGTATSTAAAATVSKQSGIVTSEALTTAAGASWDLVLTNTKIAATSKVFASVQNGTNSQGIPVVGAITPGSGSATIKVFNLHASQAFNGTIKVTFGIVG